MPMMSDPLEVVDAQATIIALQSETINELFQLLMQHISAEEADRLPCVAKINEAAVIRRRIQPPETR